MRISFLGSLVLLLYSQSLMAQDLQAPRRVENAVIRQDWREAQNLIDQFYKAFPTNPNELQLVAKYELEKWVPLVRKNVQEESALYQRISTERNQNLAQSYLDRYPFGQYRLAVSWVLATAKNTVAGYQNFLSNFPSSDEATLARQRILEADKFAFDTARQRSTSAAFDQYLLDFPQGNFVSQARELKQNALESEAFAMAEADGSVGGWQNFLVNFPNGKRLFEANAALETAYFQAAERPYQRKNWAEAISAYQTYLAAYPSGKYREEAQRKWNTAKLRLKSSPQTFTYLAYERDAQNQIGISIGGLAAKGGNAYFKLKSNKELFSRGGLLYTVDEDGSLNFDGSVRYSGEVQENRWSAILGGNFFIWHPVHLYLGGGIQNTAAYFEADRLNSDGEFKSTSWIKYIGDQEYKFIAEGGLAFNLLNYGTLRTGVNYVNNEIRFQWGLGIRIGK